MKIGSILLISDVYILSLIVTPRIPSPPVIHCAYPIMNLFSW